MWRTFSWIYTAENLCWQRTISDYFYSIFLYTYLKCILLHKWFRSEWNYSCHVFQSYPDCGNRIDSNAILFHHDSEPAPMKWTFWMTTSLCNDRFCGQLTTYYMARHMLIFTYSSSNKFAMRSVCPWAQIVWMQENGLENQTECEWKWKSLTQVILGVSKKNIFFLLRGRRVLEVSKKKIFSFF